MLWQLLGLKEQLPVPGLSSEVHVSCSFCSCGNPQILQRPEVVLPPEKSPPPPHLPHGVSNMTFYPAGEMQLGVFFGGELPQQLLVRLDG